MREIDTAALEAKKDQHLLETLIKSNESFILKCSARATNRYITKSDDEWSIALLAFCEAVESYDLNKGNFLKFSELVIKRRLIDYIRKQVKYNKELPVDPIVFDTEPEEDDEDIPIRLAVAKQVSESNHNDIQLEIITVNAIFKDYGFSFYDLSKCSPSAQKTRTACAKAINYLLNNSVLRNEMYHQKQLPLKIIEKNTKVPRKILERHRKYIIAAIEILSGEYPYLAEYLRYIREEKES